MRVRCRLREIRDALPRKDDGTKVSLRDIQARAGVSAGVLSQLERGAYLPPDRFIDQLEHADGVELTDWYDARTLVVLQADGDDA